ncbi:MAG: ABC transporter ATP-binding protein [Desulfobacterales bacterium]|jgi:branched-chain amino acid transport system ATP-binding protein
MLKIRDLHVSYGNAEILHGISFDVPEGSLVTLIGTNGAGKTTTLLAISGLLKPKAGKIEFGGVAINGKRPDEIIAKGIAQCPEGRRVFPAMSVSENLEIGGYTNLKQMRQRMDFCYTMFPRLHERHKQAAGTLSGGEQQMLAIARALMASPKLLMFDEPSMGLAPNLVEKVGEIIAEINRQGTTVLLVEQNAFMALNMATMGYVLETGQIKLFGRAAELLENDHIQKAYLGL